MVFFPGEDAAFEENKAVPHDHCCSFVSNEICPSLEFNIGRCEWQENGRQENKTAAGWRMIEGE